MNNHQLLATVLLTLSLTSPVLAKPKSQPTPRHQENNSTCYLRTSDGRTLNLASLCGSSNNNPSLPTTPGSSSDNYSNNNYSNNNSNYRRYYADPISDPTSGGRYDDPIKDLTSGGRYNDPFTDPSYNGRYDDPIKDPTSGGRYRDPFSN